MYVASETSVNIYRVRRLSPLLNNRLALAFLFGFGTVGKYCSSTAARTAAVRLHYFSLLAWLASTQLPLPSK